MTACTLLLLLLASPAQSQEAPAPLATPDRVVPIAGDARPGPVTQIVLHATGGPSCNPDIAFRSGTLDGIVRYFQERTDGISIHYVIGRDGTLVAMVPEAEAAAHARGHNPQTVGIELINRGNGEDAYGLAQIDRLTDLLADLLVRWELPSTAITTHEALDSRFIECTARADGTLTETVNHEGRGFRRSQDPGANFPLHTVVQTTEEKVGRLQGE